MKLLILGFLSLLMISASVFEVSACLQIAGRPSVGVRVKVEGVSPARFIRDFTTHANRAYWQKVRAELLKDKRQFTFQIRNNLAVALLHLGRVEEAIPILEELEKKYPGTYIVAANLGTAYELNGENAKALKWIKESVLIDFDSHFGTEWLHVKILETKLALEKDPEWLKSRSVLGSDFGTNRSRPASEIFATDFLRQRRSLNEIEEALVYQLHERLEFIKPPEPIVADLLRDLSRVFAVLRTPGHARAVNGLAVKYGAVPKSAQRKK